MMGWSPRCYIPSVVEIGPPVPEKKIFERFLPYMGVVDIFVMLPTCRKQNFVPPIKGGFTLNLVLIDQVVSEKKMLEHCERKTTDGRRTTDGPTTPTDAGPLVYYKLTYEPFVQVIR